ncbi:hypothetical protein C8R43DRAFT_1049814 [Mycena crocata]|nr:hypothetical protein C8R43DRAFT_1049814 [Mycena crocata]
MRVTESSETLSDGFIRLSVPDCVAHRRKQPGSGLQGRRKCIFWIFHCFDLVCRWPAGATCGRSTALICCLTQGMHIPCIHRYIGNTSMCGCVRLEQDLWTARRFSDPSRYAARRGLELAWGTAYSAKLYQSTRTTPSQTTRCSSLRPYHHVTRALRVLPQQRVRAVPGDRVADHWGVLN